MRDAGPNLPWSVGPQDEPVIAPRLPVPRPAPVEGLSLCVLGSGSGGNVSVVRHGSDMLLIDAGLGPVTVARRLGQARSMVGAIRAIVLTHLDADHLRPTWLATIAGFGIAVYVHHWHESSLRRLEGADAIYTAGLVRQFDFGSFEPAPGLTMTAVGLRHDQQGTCGFIAASRWGRFGYATDLGCVPSTLIDAAAGVDLLAIESNYDPQMQLASQRPAFLKRRIMGEAGHLSNQQAFDAVAAIAARSPNGLPRDVVLLHRSSQCNTTDHIDAVFDQNPALRARIHHTHQRRRTRWFHIRRRSHRQTHPGVSAAQLHLPFV